MRETRQTTEQNQTQTAKKFEQFTADDGTKYFKNLQTKDKSFTWLYKIQKGRYKATIIQKRTTHAVPSQEADSGFYVEREQESLSFILEQGIKKGDEWENIKMEMSLADARNLQFVFDALDNVAQVFRNNNSRRDAQ